MSITGIVTDSGFRFIGVPVPPEDMLVTDTERFRLRNHCCRCGKKFGGEPVPVSKLSRFFCQACSGN